MLTGFNSNRSSNQATSSTNPATYTKENGETYAIMDPAQFTEFMNQFQTLAKGIPKAIKDIRPTANLTRESTHITPPNYHGRMDEDPLDWVDQFEIAKNANSWGNDRAADIAAGCMKDAAARWYLANKDQIDRWYTNGNNTNFKTKFLEKFATDIRQDAWHQIYRRLEQGDQTVDEYVIAFEKALERIDPNYSVAMARKDFEKGLKQ